MRINVRAIYRSSKAPIEVELTEADAYRAWCRSIIQLHAAIASVSPIVHQFLSIFFMYLPYT